MAVWQACVLKNPAVGPRGRGSQQGEHQAVNIQFHLGIHVKFFAVNKYLIILDFPWEPRASAPTMVVKNYMK